MSAADDAAAEVGGWLADLVEEGKITDAVALGYMAGDPRARQLVTEILEADGGP